MHCVAEMLSILFACGEAAEAGVVHLYHQRLCQQCSCVVLQMLEKPLQGSRGKEVLQELMGLLPELFDENIKAVTLIGGSLGDMLTTNQLSPTEVRDHTTALCQRPVCISFCCGLTSTTLAWQAHVFRQHHCDALAVP